MKFSRVLAIVMVLLCVSAAAFAQEGVTPEKHTFFIGINPITAFLSYYQIEAALALTGLFEVGVQCSILDITGFTNIFLGGAASGANYFMDLSAIVRIFPGQDARGFFISARLSYLNFSIEGLPEANLSDFAVGIDLGVRIRWMFEGWGLILQFYGGIERSFLHQEEVGIPIWPVGGLHFGVCF